jgi:hypothetical protein
MVAPDWWHRPSDRETRRRVRHDESVRVPAQGKFNAVVMRPDATRRGQAHDVK